MTDIIERLERYPPYPARFGTEAHDAAAEIKQLRMQLADHGETITRLQEQLTVVRELRDCDMREIERLRAAETHDLRCKAGFRAEIERLTEALHWWQSIEQVRLNSEIERLTAERDAYHESNERLAAIVSGKNAEIERLREAIKDELETLRTSGIPANDPLCMRLRRALEPEP